jgi:hypothetical protein
MQKGKPKRKGKRKCEGNKKNLLLVDNHGRSKPTMSRLPICVNIIIGPNALVAVLLNIRFAWLAAAAATDDDSHADHIACTEAVHFRAHFNHLSHHFMPKYIIKNIYIYI